MQGPRIEIKPIKGAVCSDGPTTLDVLVRVVPPTPEVHFVRPPINLGLVLDHSGSMAAAKKMDYAREAACFAVEQLLATDRVSVTIFDSIVETIAPNAPVKDKAGILRGIRTIVPRGATALHAGWKEGGSQVEANFITGGLNRVILLSDGLANEGLTDPNVIANEAKALAGRGVSTSTMGLGDDYNEDLMQAMGEAGDGNYYFIESPLQLADIFHTELQGLMANVGQKVGLEIELNAGVTVGEVLNDFDRDAQGRWALPNLVAGMPIPIVVRFKLPAVAGEVEVCRLRLSWDDPKGGARRTTIVPMMIGSCPSSRWEALPADPEVAEQVALLMAARAKKEAIAAYDRGDITGTREHVALAFADIQAMPLTAGTSRELEEIIALQADLEQAQGAKFRKRAAWQSYRRKSGKDS